MTVIKNYSDAQWTFIKAYEERDPIFADFLNRWHEHDARYDQEFHGMTRQEILRLENDLEDDDRLSAESAWMLVHDDLQVEQLDLLHYDYGLRARSEAAWRDHQIQKVKATVRGFLQRFRLML